MGRKLLVVVASAVDRNLGSVSSPPTSTAGGSTGRPDGAHEWALPANAVPTVVASHRERAPRTSRVKLASGDISAVTPRAVSLFPTRATAAGDAENVPDGTDRPVRRGRDGRGRRRRRAHRREQDVPESADIRHSTPESSSSSVHLVGPPDSDCTFIVHLGQIVREHTNRGILYVRVTESRADQSVQ